VSDVRVKAAVTVRQPRSRVYRFWRDFENFPQFMIHLESVQPTGDRHSHWVATAPAGRTVEWDAELVEEREDELIAWRSLPGSDIGNEGFVRFVDAPGDRGTEIHVELSYDAPGGGAGDFAAKLFGEQPHQQVKDDLRRCKQVLETGGVVRSDGTPHGISAPGQVRQRPAQPVSAGRE
jgi:uncharacterized membrane protein